MEKENKKYELLISNYLSNLPGEKYIVVGGASTLSYTSKTGYERSLHDLDLVADTRVASKLTQKLIKDGFIQSTFIDKRMPFYRNLVKQSKSFYLRFSKDDVNFEILSTKFVKRGKLLKFDLYPNLWVEIPAEFLVTSQIGNTKFTTLDIDFHFALMQFLNNTLGRVMRYKAKQRKEDLKNIAKLVNKQDARKKLNQGLFGYSQLKFRVPGFLLGL